MEVRQWTYRFIGYKMENSKNEDQYPTKYLCILRAAPMTYEAHYLHLLMQGWKNLGQICTIECKFIIITKNIFAGYAPSKGAFGMNLVSKISTKALYKHHI